MLPTSYDGPVYRSWQAYLPEFLSRSIHLDQMEFDNALSQMWHCLTNPGVTARISKARKMTKNYYHRDDPAFIVLQGLFIVVVTVAFGLALEARLMHILVNAASHVVLYYLAVGALCASVSWSYANNFLMGSASSFHEVRREVEWHYAFDVHCNGYFGYFMYTSVVRFLLLPLIMSGDRFFPRLIGNGLYVIGVGAYCANAFRGYLELPMLSKQQNFIYPLFAAIGVGLVLTLLTHVNVALVAIHYWWALGA